MKILYPFSLIYGIIILIRNKLFDFGFIKQESFNIPIISIGNLSIGGTGKTPHIEYLISKYQSKKNIVVISRGYGRKTSGFRYVEINDDAKKTGDEPLQIKTKYPEIIVAVCEKRTLAVKNVISDFPNTNLILLDDAFQHRYINRNLNILLTSFQKPFWNDCVIPCGTLREFKAGYKRADLIIVTKSQKNRTCNIPEYILKKPIFFSEIQYEEPVVFYGCFTKKVIVVTGIANDLHFINYLINNNFDILHHFKFADHYSFKDSDIEKINSKVKEFENSMIITTEKDFARLKKYYLNSEISIAFIPIKVKIENEQDFLNLCNTIVHLQ